MTDLNAAIRECLERLDTRPLKKLKKSRQELFEAIDIPNALSLSPRPYEYAEWYKSKVQLNYHIKCAAQHFICYEELDIMRSSIDNHL